MARIATGKQHLPGGYDSHAKLSCARTGGGAVPEPSRADRAVRSKTAPTNVPDPASDIERATLRRVTWRILPFLMLAYFIAFVDRVNAGFAALQMNHDIGLSAIENVKVSMNVESKTSVGRFQVNDR